MSLDGTYDDGNIFAKILRGEMPCAKVFEDGEVFAFNFEGEPVVKRLQRDSATWWMASDNPDQRRYPRKECSDAHCIILGRVVHRQSERI